MADVIRIELEGKDVLYFSSTETDQYGRMQIITVLGMVPSGFPIERRKPVTDPALRTLISSKLRRQLEKYGQDVQIKYSF